MWKKVLLLHFFQSMLKKVIFLEDRKKCNLVPVHKKESKTLIKTYWPISILPISSKIFETLVINSLFNYFTQNKCFTECQSGFLPGDTCVAQLLSIPSVILKSFNSGQPADMRGIFLDISKAFDKVWHEGLISYALDSDLLKLFIHYLEDRKQGVALNGFFLENISVGVSQGSALSPILFLTYINDLSDGVNSICKISVCCWT